MQRLATDPAFANVAVFRVDFDTSKDLLRQWKVAQQSTLIAFKGRTERRRSVAETQPDALRMVFEAARQ